MATSRDMRGNLRVDVLDERGGRLIGHARLRIEAAPPSGRVERGHLEPDPGVEIGDGPRVLRLPSGDTWEVELRRGSEGSAMVVLAAETPNMSEVGGE